MSDGRRDPIIVRAESWGLNTDYELGRALRWVGELVEADAPVVELLTDAATLEVSAPVRGVITKFAPEGFLKVGDPIFEIQPVEGDAPVAAIEGGQVALCALWDARPLATLCVTRQAWAAALVADRARRNQNLYVPTHYDCGPDLVEGALIVGALTRAIQPFPALNVPAILSPGKLHINYAVGSLYGARWSQMTSVHPDMQMGMFHDARPGRDPDARITVIRLHTDDALADLPADSAGLTVILGGGATDAETAQPAWAPITLLAEGAEQRSALRPFLAALVAQLASL